MPGYVAAYEATYRHHYAMQDEWRTIINDPDLPCYAGVDAATLRRQYLEWFTGKYDFEFFERAMLCVADDAFWRESVRSHSGWTWSIYETTWISRWRRRLGRPVTRGVDDQPKFQYLVWKNNWAAVRDEVAALNTQSYPADYEMHKRDSRNDEWFYTKGNSMDASLVDLAKRLAWELGWYEDTVERPKIAPAGWHAFSMQATRQLNTLIGGAWRPFIEAKSGREARGTEASAYIGNAQEALDFAMRQEAIEAEAKVPSPSKHRPSSDDETYI